MTKEPDLAARIHYDPFERRSGLVRFLPLDTDPLAWASGTAGELGDAVEGAFEVVSLEDGQLVAVRDATVTCGRRPGGGSGDQADRDRRRPPVSQPATRGHRREPIHGQRRCATRPRMDADDARWRRQSGRLDRAGRIARPPRLARDGVRRDDHRPGQRLHRRRPRLQPVRAGRRLVGAGRDDLELGGRLRACLPGGRLPVQLAAGARGRCIADGRRDPRRDHDT